MTTAEITTLRVFKFIVPSDRDYPIPSCPGLSARGCVAVCIAESEMAARMKLTEYAAENGLQSIWLEVAKVISLPVVRNGVITWVES